jgi:hypothetical protein
MVLSVCRDELLLPVEDAVHEVWGPSFDASSLAGLPLLGRTGMAAALGHTPVRTAGTASSWWRSRTSA